MCTVCGCGASGKTGGGHTPQPHRDDPHAHDADHVHSHVHDHDHPHGHGHDHDHHHGHDHPHGHHHSHDHAPAILPHRHPGDPAASAALRAEPVTPRLIRIEQDILAHNDRLAADNRAHLRRHGITAINLMSGPGSGKTTLLVRSIDDLAARMPVAVIEGDQETSVDAERIRATGAAALQVNTGNGCHLDARMIDRALGELAPPPGAVLFIENVGNLVCPAAFDLGESARVVLLSVTEGDDKPLKYPQMFAAADLLLITKIDLAPYVPFNVERCRSAVHRVNPAIDILEVSAMSGAGLESWYGWLDHRRQAASPPGCVVSGHISRS